MKLRDLNIILLLVILFASCRKEELPATQPSVPAHVITTDSSFSLGGQTWVLTQYRDTDMANPIPANDTLIFIDSTHYTWNGVNCTYRFYSTTYDYSLYGSGHTNSTAYYLSFDGTPLGQLNAQVSISFLLYGFLEDTGFGYYYWRPRYYMWYQRI